MSQLNVFRTCTIALTLLASCGSLAAQRPAPAPAPNPNTRPRLGVWFQEYTSRSGYRCLRVTRVTRGGPATNLWYRGKRYYMVAGRDFITEINGTRVRSEANLLRELALSQKRCIIRVYDSKYDTHRNYDVRLWN